MSKLVNYVARKDRFVITEREDTGKIEFIRVSNVTGNRSRMYIAENRTDGRNWLRTHPEVDSALYTYVAPVSIAESLKTEVYGTGPSVLFSPNVSNAKHGTPEERETLTREFTKHLQGKAAAALARAAAQHPDISTAGEMHGPHAGITGEWGAEPGYSWNMFGGPLDRDAQEILTKEFTDEFKQDAAGIHDPNANTKELFYHTNKIKTMNGELPTNQKPIMKEAKEEKTPLAKLIQGSIEDNQQARNVTTTRAAVDFFGRPLVRDETGTTLLPADIKRNGPRGPKGGIVNLGRGDVNVAYDDQESPEEGGRRVVPSGHGPDAYETREEESTMENDDKITESMFLTGDNNTLVGQSQVDYRNMLAGEIFGAAAFSTQRPHADTHEGANVVMDTQTAEGMGVLRPVGAPSANMNEDTSFNKHMLNMAKSLFRANRMDEAAKIVDALDSPATAAVKVLEAALATDGVVDEKLTEDLYNAAAYYSSLNNG